MRDMRTAISKRHSVEDNTELANPPTREQLPFYASGLADVRAPPSTWAKASIALLTNLK